MVQYDKAIHAYQTAFLMRQSSLEFLGRAEVKHTGTTGTHLLKMYSIDYKSSLSVNAFSRLI